MKKKYLVTCLFSIFVAGSSLTAISTQQNYREEVFDSSSTAHNVYQKVEDAAQYGEADWNNLVKIVRSISLEEAKQIADNDPNITYFFYTKGGQMVLGTGKNDESYRIFRFEDAVFFSGTPCWGAAHGLADGYIKK